MKFKFVKEEKYLGKIKLINLKEVARGICMRCSQTDMEHLVDPILTIAIQNKLNIKVTEKMVCGQKLIFFEYEDADIIKAVHILNISTVLN
jgi:hypothetical protein